MSTILRIFAGLSLAVVLAMGVGALGQPAVAQQPIPENEVPVVPTDNGEAVQGLISARHFTLDSPFIYNWNMDRPQVSEGTIIVLEVDPEYVVPRNVNVPVIYVGDTPAMVTNQGYESGRLIVVAPGRVDLTKTPVYFGSFQLPEAVNAARGQEELDAALEMGIRPFDAKTVADAFVVGGEQLGTSDLDFLMLEVSNLILDFCPDEVDLAVGLAMAVGQ